MRQRLFPVVLLLALSRSPLTGDQTRTKTATAAPPAVTYGANAGRRPHLHARRDHAVERFFRAPFVKKDRINDLTKSLEKLRTPPGSKPH